MNAAEERELRWALWAIESAYRSGLTLASCLRLIAAIVDGRPFLHVVAGAT